MQTPAHMACVMGKLLWPLVHTLPQPMQPVLSRSQLPNPPTTDRSQLFSNHLLMDGAPLLWGVEFVGMLSSRLSDNAGSFGYHYFWMAVAG